jgi:hypothetical protein
MPSTATPTALHQALLARLIPLPYPALLAVARDLLSALGYEDVRPVDRAGKRGKNRSGGFDLDGYVTVGPGRRRVIAQVKQMATDAKTHQRALDEVRGAALRTGASEALVLTTGTFSYVVQAQLERQGWAAHAGNAQVIPVRCLDGTQLAQLLVSHGIGVAGEGGELRLDEGYFASLPSHTPGVARQAKGAVAEDAPQRHRVVYRSGTLRRVPLSKAQVPVSIRVERGSRPSAPSVQLSIQFVVPPPAEPGRD